MTDLVLPPDPPAPTIESTLQARVLTLEEQLADITSSRDEARTIAGTWQDRAVTLANCVGPAMEAAHRLLHGGRRYSADWRRCHAEPCRLLVDVDVSTILTGEPW